MDSCGELFDLLGKFPFFFEQFVVFTGLLHVLNEFLAETGKVEVGIEFRHDVGQSLNEEGLVARDGHIVTVDVRIVLQLRAEVLGTHLKLVGNYPNIRKLLVTVRIFKQWSFLIRKVELQKRADSFNFLKCLEDTYCDFLLGGEELWLLRDSLEFTTLRDQVTILAF